jgi:hypothetical protein
MTHRRRFRWIAWGALAVVAGCAVTASRPAAIDPQADDILKRMCDTISAAPTLAFEADAQVDERLDTGRLVRLHRHSKVIAARPDRLFVEMAGDEVGGRFWYEKGRLTVLDRGANAYASIAVPDRTEKMLDYVVEKYHVTVPLADLFFPNLYETLTESIESGVYVGVESVEGRDCHHLAFSQAHVDWEIWIDAGERPLPRQIAITYKEEPDAPQYIAVLDKWDLAAAPTAETFRFQPPAGAKAVSVDEMIVRDRGE